MITTYLATHQTVIKAPVHKVWEALTDAEIVKQYFFDSNLNTDWKPGNPITFAGEYEGKAYVDKGVVQQYVPDKELTFSYLSSWSGMPDVPENYLMVKYHVRAVEDGTELTITQSNYDQEKADHSASNWANLTDGIKKLLE